MTNDAKALLVPAGVPELMAAAKGGNIVEAFASTVVLASAGMLVLVVVTVDDGGFISALVGKLLLVEVVSVTGADADADADKDAPVQEVESTS